MSVISTADFIKKYSHVNFHLLAQKTSESMVRERLLGIHNLMLGKNRIEAALAVGRNPEWLRTWVLRYDAGGLANLYDAPRSGRAKLLTPDQEQCLTQEILSIQDNRNGGRVTGNDIRDLIFKKYGVTYKGTSVYDVLERLGMSWVSSRSKHPKANEQDQIKFKQTFKARVARIKKKEKTHRSLVPR